jgi:anti-sigma regulatory factor (Ser/Thr protein kinase)
VVDDFELIVSELVTNAVRHGDGGPIELQAAADGHVVLAVASGGEPDALPPVAEWTLPAPGAPSGRGLAIVHRLCDEVDFRRSGERLVVCCRRQLPDGGGYR